MNTTTAQPAPVTTGEGEAPYDQLTEAAEDYKGQVEREGREIEHLKAEIAELKAEAHALSEDTGTRA